MVVAYPPYGFDRRPEYRCVSDKRSAIRQGKRRKTRLMERVIYGCNRASAFNPPQKLSIGDFQRW